MSDSTWSCTRVRQVVESSLGKPEGAQGIPEEVWLHLSACDGCLDWYLEAGLHCPPDVAIPSEFTERILTRLAGAAAAPHQRRNIHFPYYTLAAGLLAIFYALPILDWNTVAGALGGAATLLGPYFEALANFHITTDNLLLLLFGLAAIEMAASTVWLWRLSRR